MKILLIVPGNLKTVPMSSFSEKALKALGHEVASMTFHESSFEKLKSKIKQMLGCTEKWVSANQRIKKKIIIFKPDLLFTIYGTQLSENTLNLCRQLGIQTACWWINDPFQFERGLKLAKNYDYWFSNSEQCAKDIEEKLGVKSSFLPTACEPEVHKPREIDANLNCDVCFAGDWSPQRQEAMESLVAEGFNIKIFGPWKKKLKRDSALLPYLTSGFFTPEQMSEYFSNCKVVLNLHTWHKKFSHGVNPRLFEAAACKVAQVVDIKDEMSFLFNIDNELITFEDLDELSAIIRKLLSDDKKRERIAFAAYKRVVDKHTYQIRMQEMIDFVFHDSIKHTV